MSLRRFVRTGLFAVALAALLAGGVAVSGYGGRALVALKAFHWNLDIERAMDAVGVAPGMVVGEAGAGDGYVTLPMAHNDQGLRAHYDCGTTAVA